jgi:CDGSH-type Zn-finger protein
MVMCFPGRLSVNDLFRAPHDGDPVVVTTTIVPYEDGPLIIRGDFELRTQDGKPIDPGRDTIALCRCGKSAIKPFCDGTHSAVRFRAGSDREAPGPR